MRIGFVGVGAMGAPMVGRLVSAGHHVIAHARRDAARHEATSRGAVLAESVIEAASGAAVVILCPFTDVQVLELAFDEGVLAAMAAGSVLVVHTTGSPTTARRIAAAAPPGVGVLDAPVSGSATDVADGHITLFVGGDDDTVAAARPALASYGDPVLHVGPLGAGQAVKLLNNSLFAAHLQLAADASRLAVELGIDPAVAAAAVGHGSGASRAVAVVGGDAVRLSALRPYLDKDMDVLQAVASELGIDLGVLGRTNAAGPLPFGSA